MYPPTAGSFGRSPRPSRFLEALDLATEQRAAFLDAVCADKPELHAELEALLQAAARVEKKPGWNSATVAAGAAARMDRYELRERIGSGGMGVVYRAERKDGDFTKEVALKIVHSDDPALLQRFHQERQILAGLVHPNIARLLDVGTTEDGRPFLAMDYIAGEPLDKYVSQRGLTHRQILGLFRKIAAAVSYAHANLIVHRDLKPANILVTATGEPKLLDFGIARLLDPNAEKTRTGLSSMTPEYASPEQVSGLPTTVASDIYSLGVLLYRLLSGASPYPDTPNPAELATAIISGSPRPLTGVDGDIEKIVQMAMRKEPERRYRSVEQFSEDIRRYLEGYPVAAQSDTAGYRASKFIGRNRIPLAVAALLLAVMAAGVVSTLRQERIAQRHFNDVRKLANSYIFEVYDSLQNLQGATATRKLVVKRAVEYLDSLAKEQANDAGLNGELGSAYFRVATLQGEPGMPNLGDPEGALVSYRRSLEIRERLAQASPSEVQPALDVVESLRGLGNLLVFRSDVTNAAKYLGRAVTLGEGLAKAHAGDPRVLQALAAAYLYLANVTGNNEYPNLGNWKGAEQLYSKAVAMREQMAQANPGDRKNRISIAVLEEKMAANFRLQNRDSDAVAAFRKAIAIGEAVSQEEPDNVMYRRQIAVDSRSLSLLWLSMKNLPEARKTGDRATAIFEDLARADPNNVQAEEEVADSLWSQGFILEKEKDTAGAFSKYEASIAKYQKAMREHPGLMPLGMRTAWQLTAGLSAAGGDTTRATAAAQKEMEIDEQMLKVSPGDIGPQLNRGVALYQIAMAHQVRAEKTRDKGEWREAVAWGKKSMEIWVGLQRDSKLNPAYSTFMTRTQTVLDKASQGLK